MYLTSFLKIEITLVTGIEITLELAHNLTGRISGINNIIDQFRCSIEEPGSKVENKLVIILFLFSFLRLSLIGS